MPRGEGPVPDRNLALDLVRCTEAAALAAARWVGRGDKNAADGAAVDAMRLMFNTVAVDGIVVIGEGEKDEAPMLYNGQHVGTGTSPARSPPRRKEPASTSCMGSAVRPKASSRPLP